MGIADIVYSGIAGVLALGWGIFVLFKPTKQSHVDFWSVPAIIIGAIMLVVAIAGLISTLPGY